MAWGILDDPEELDAEFPVWAAARRYVELGFAVFPVSVDGSRHPLVKWKPYQDRLPTARELELWFLTDKPPGIGLLVGPVSDNLVALDFDDYSIYRRWKSAVRKQWPNVWKKFVIVRTPSGGRHIYFRCNGWIDCKIGLAYRCPPRERPDVAIEFYQHKHFLAAPGSPLEVHRLNKPYQCISHRGFDDLATLSVKSVLRLIEIAKTFDERPYKATTAFPRTPAKRNNSLPTGSRPGDLFNARTTWEEVLQPHGWVAVGLAGGVTHWRRPGKDNEDRSATTNFGGSDLLHIFSSNASPFEQNETYSKFAAFALLNHNGDFHAAAEELRRRGDAGTTRRFSTTPCSFAAVRAISRKSLRGRGRP